MLPMTPARQARQAAARRLARLDDAVAAPLIAAVAAVPPERRFARACSAARVLEPYWRLRLLGSIRFDGYREEALGRVLEGLARRRVPFGVSLVVRGEDEIPNSAALLVTGHFRLNRLFLRWLHDRGRGMSVVMRKPRSMPCVWGTPDPVHTVLSDARVFVRLRHPLAEGRLVIVDLDGPDPRPGAGPVDTVTGPRYVSDRAFRFAAGLDIPVTFFATRVEAGGEVVTTVTRLEARDPTEALAEYGRHLAEAASRIARSSLVTRPGVRERR